MAFFCPYIENYFKKFMPQGVTFCRFRGLIIEGVFFIHASMDPAREVGGDFYDFFMIDENHLALVIADVSGNGIPAALFMMSSKIFISDHTTMGGTPAEIICNPSMNH